MVLSVIDGTVKQRHSYLQFHEDYRKVHTAYLVYKIWFITRFIRCFLRCLIVNFAFSHFGFWNGNDFQIAPFPGHCLLVPLGRRNENLYNGPGHVIKIAAMPIYGKILKKSFSVELMDRF